MLEIGKEPYQISPTSATKLSQRKPANTPQNIFSANSDSIKATQDSNIFLGRFSDDERTSDRLLYSKICRYMQNLSRFELDKFLNTSSYQNMMDTFGLIDFLRST